MSFVKYSHWINTTKSGSETDEAAILPLLVAILALLAC